MKPPEVSMLIQVTPEPNYRQLLEDAISELYEHGVEAHRDVERNELRAYIQLTEEERKAWEAAGKPQVPFGIHPNGSQKWHPEPTVRQVMARAYGPIPEGAKIYPAHFCLHIEGQNRIGGVVTHVEPPIEALVAFVSFQVASDYCSRLNRTALPRVKPKYVSFDAAREIAKEKPQTVAVAIMAENSELLDLVWVK